MLSPAESSAEIERFTEFVGSSTRSKTVLAWKPGTYTYLFVPTRRAVRFIARRIRGRSIPRRVGSLFFRAGTVYPSALKFCPPLSTHSVTVPEEYDFDVAIAGYRLKLLDFTDRTVLTLPIDVTNSRRNNLLRTEIDVRRRLPESIPAPSVLDTDHEYPFILDEYVDGAELADPVSGWGRALAALRSLRPLYLQPPSTLISVETVLTDIDDALRMRGLTDQPAFSTARESVENLDLPSHLRWCRIHGDFHAGNLLVDDETVHILDWENTTIGYPTTDFLSLFLMQYLKTGDPNYVVQMIRGEGTGGAIGREYATALGPTVYDSDDWYGGVVLVGLLQSMLKQHDPTDGELLTLLEAVESRIR